MNYCGWGFGVLALAVAIAGCTAKPTLPDYRYRMTVEVETPAGLKSGSSVIEVSETLNRRNTDVDNVSTINTDVRGEAVAVDLPGGKTLFALLVVPLRDGGAASYALDAFPGAVARSDDEYVQRLRLLKARHDVGILPEQFYPMLITFGNPRDPKTAAAVEPGDLANSFGAGAVLKRITVQMTNAPVTTGIEKRLGWLSPHPNLSLKPGTIRLGSSIAALFHHGDFLRRR